MTDLAPIRRDYARNILERAGISSPRLEEAFAATFEMMQVMDDVLRHPAAAAFSRHPVTPYLAHSRAQTSCSARPEGRVPRLHFTVARPIPVPSKWAAAWRRENTPNSLSA